jgi:hypothetical protein
MTILYRQHIPAFCEGFDPQIAEVNSTEELLELNSVSQWRYNFKDFYRYSIDDNHLMAELDEGRKWYVVGYVRGNVELPKWEKKRVNMKTLSQEGKILLHMINGHKITPLRALKKFGTFRLGARIFNLKKKGHKIFRTMITVDGKRFAQYWM